MGYYVDDEGIRVEDRGDGFEVHTKPGHETVWIYRDGEFQWDCQSEQEAYDWIDETLDDEMMEKLDG